jgi:ADP-ribose pyrophosphatase YjhB (NUDIX family)
MPSNQPDRPTPTCCACIVHEGRLLLIRRAEEPNKGYWSHPGGRIELGETVFEAIRREVLEETGIQIEPIEIFQVYDWIIRDEDGRVRLHYLVNYVRARYVSGEARALSDAADVRWVTASDLPTLTMHPFARQTAERVLGEANIEG